MHPYEEQSIVFVARSDVNAPSPCSLPLSHLPSDTGISVRTLLLLTPLALLLAACEEGEITIRLTDAPADDLTRFEIGLAGVDIEHEDGDTTRFDFDPPRVIDIVPLRDGNSITLIDAARVDADDYRAVQLRFEPPTNTGGGRPAARFNGDQLDIRYEEEEARFEVEFSIDDFDSENLLLDLDLRRSVRENDEDIGNARLRFIPQMRAVVTGDAGAIAGTLGPNVVNRAQCSPGVYVYEGFDQSPTTLGSDDPPLVSKVPRNVNITGAPYRIEAIDDGEYTIAVTCDAGIDDPDPDEVEADVNFIATANVRVRAGQTVTRDFP